MTIRVLSEETINKIAAGEVVERPANVLKELVENALDAQSSSIEIEIKGAGRQLLRVRDDGTGMTKDEMSVAIERHATSKISEFDDLTRLATFGFRGEALPSIAAVSKLLIQSVSRSTGEGWELRINGGRTADSRAYAGAPGTTIEVTDLFFNTPARAKFLKSDGTERSRMLHAIEEMALAWPERSFSFVSEGKTLLKAPKARSSRERMMDVLGGEFAEKLLAVETRHPFLAVTAFITRPDESLANRNYQYVFINRRPITPNKVILHAIYEAYREALPVGRHPGFVLFLDIDPAEIDVNIHPTKREVRLSKEQEIHQFIYRAFKDTLSRTPFANMTLPGTTDADGEQLRQPSPAPELRFPASPAAPEAATVGERPPVNGYAASIAAIRDSNLFVPSERTEPYRQADFAASVDTEHAPVIVGQIFNLYVIAQLGDEMLIIDQHAAAERVRYEAYCDQYAKREIPVQPLLFAQTIELPPSQAGLLLENLALIAGTGWQIEEFGANTVRVTGTPAVLGGDLPAKEALDAILHALMEESKLPPAEKIEHIMRAACRSSIKSGDAIAPQETERLLRDLFRCRSPYTCPHGRPTVYKLSVGELERFFARK